MAETGKFDPSFLLLVSELFPTSCPRLWLTPRIQFVPFAINNQVSWLTLYYPLNCLDRRFFANLNFKELSDVCLYGLRICGLASSKRSPITLVRRFELLSNNVALRICVLWAMGTPFNSFFMFNPGPFVSTFALAVWFVRPENRRPQDYRNTLDVEEVWSKLRNSFSTIKPT